MEDEDFLKDYIMMFKRNQFLIIFIIIIGSAFSVYYTMQQTPVYQARAVVSFSGQEKFSYILGQQVVRYDLATQSAIIRSSNVLGPVYAELKSGFSVDAAAVKDSTTLIEIKTEANSPEIAKQAANKVAESYINYSILSQQNDAITIMNFISSQITNYQVELNSLNEQAMQYKDRKNLTQEERTIYQGLTQQITAKDKLLSTLMTKREEIGIQTRQGIGNIKIIQLATTPVLPVRPNHKTNITLGVILSIMAAFGVVFAIEYFRNTYNSQNSIEEDAKLPIIGSLPLLHIKRGKNTLDHYLQSVNNMHDKFTEHVRMIRTNLHLHLKEKGSKIISVTSPVKGDGKSTLAINLAFSFAKHHTHTLLVDANIRNPMLQNVFPHESILNNKGLGEVLKGEANFKEVIVKTSEPYLNVLFAGDMNHNPGELFSSTKMEKLFKYFKELPYDVIIIDAPQLDYYESAIIAQSSDGVLFVVRQGKTQKDKVASAKTKLSKVNANIIGIVVNAKQ